MFALPNGSSQRGDWHSVYGGRGRPVEHCAYFGQAALGRIRPVYHCFFALGAGRGLCLALLYARGYGVRSIPWSRWHVVGGMGIALNYALYALSLSYTTASVGVLVVQVQYVALTL